MKRIYTLIAAMLLLSGSTWAQTTYYWQAGAGGPWTTAANWNTNPSGGGTTRTSPAANDILIVDQGTTLTISNVGTQTIGRLHIMSGAVTLQGAGGTNTLTIANGTGSDFIVDAGASLQVASNLENLVLANNASANISGSLIINNTYNHNNNGVNTTIQSTGSLINSGSITNTTTAKLTVAGYYEHAQNGGTVPTATWAAASTTDLSSVAGSTPGGLNQTFGNFRIAGNLTSNQNLLSSNFNCAGNFTVDITGSTLRFNNSGTNRTVNIGGSYIQERGNVVLINNGGNVTMNIGGGFQLNSGSFTAVNEDGNATMNVSGDFAFNAGTFTLKGDNGNANLTISGNYTQTTGNFFLRTDNTGSVPQMNVSGLFTLEDGTFNMTSTTANGTLNLSGGFTQNGGTITETSTGTGSINFTGSAVQSFVKTGGSLLNSLAFTIANNATVDFDTYILNAGGGSFTLSSGGKIITSHPDGLASGGANGSIQTSSRTYSNTADYEFRGASTGNFTTSGNGVRDLIINNASGEITMARNFTVSRALVLSNGYLTPGSNTLLVGTGGSATSSNGAFVNGAMGKQANSNGTFSFPVGKVGYGLHPVDIVITGGGGTSTFTAEYFRNDANALGSSYGTGIERVSACEYWGLNRTGGSRTARVRLSWNAGSNCTTASAYVNNLGTLRVARLNGSTWTNEGPGTGAESGSFLAEGTILSSGNVGGFTFFALATSNASENPLPVLFADVKAYGKNNGVQIEWSNLTERDVVRYEVERSVNGVDFVSINQQHPKSNRDDKASYDHFDPSPVYGSNYYRIRVEEIDGKKVYSKILRVDLGSTKGGFAVYPNPVTGKQFTVSLAGLRQGQYSLQVLNTSGQRVYTTTINNVGSGVTQMVELPGSVQSGVYIAVISGDDYRESKQLIIK